ncbi:hypothetical protein HQ496_06395 [bacterium]|nr:hypothetical protein [bacterium]
MGRSSKIEQVVILKSKFDLEDRRVLFGTARLLPDRIVLKGWFYKRVIALNSIQEVRWSSDLVVLGLSDGEEIEMIIQSAALWKYELQARCGFTDVVQNLDKLNPGSSNGDINSTDVKGSPDFKEDLFGSKDSPTNGSATQRESSYRVKTAFAHDRPHTDH